MSESIQVSIRCDAWYFTFSGKTYHISQKPLHPFSCQALLSSNPLAIECEFCHLKYLPDHRTLHSKDCPDMKRTLTEPPSPPGPPGFLRCNKCSSLLAASEIPRHMQCHEISEHPEDVIESTEALIEEIAHNMPADK